jgi:hypothetical protein
MNQNVEILSFSEKLPSMEEIFIKAVESSNLNKLKNFSESIINSITKSIKTLPYGISYIAKELYFSMKEKFPTKEDDILKVLANLIYYRYLNPAICAPEAFDVITQVIKDNQRKNLGEISKILLNVSMNKKFNHDDTNLHQLNDLIETLGNNFIKFLKEIIKVENVNEHFKIDEYLDMAKVQKPIIFISLNEIFHVHSMIIENLESSKIPIFSIKIAAIFCFRVLMKPSPINGRTFPNRISPIDSSSFM